MLLSNGKALGLWYDNANNVRASLYDPAADNWSRTSPPPCACQLVALSDGTEFAIDDIYARPDGQSDVASYARGGPNHDWVQTAQLPDSRDYMLQVALPDDRVLVLGGDDAQGAGSPATDFYDHSANAWSSGPDLPFADVDSVGVLADGTVLAVATSGKVARLDAGASQWIAAGKVSVGTAPEVIAFGTGAIALAGSGGNQVSRPDPHTAIFDESSNSWSAGPRVPQLDGIMPGIAAAAVVLPDGRLLLVGGTQGGDFSPARGAAILSADGSAWTSVASAPVDVANDVGRVLPDGSIVFAGEASDFNNDVGPYLGAFRFTP